LKIFRLSNHNKIDLFQARIAIVFFVANSVRKSKRHYYTIIARAHSDWREVKKKFSTSTSDQRAATAAMAGCMIMRLQKRRREFLARYRAQQVTPFIRDSAANAGGNVRISDINIAKARSELLRAINIFCRFLSFFAFSNSYI